LLAALFWASFFNLEILFFLTVFFFICKQSFIKYTGWYRECNIIPHTADADIALLSHEFSIEQLKKHLAVPKITLFQTFGFLNDSFEYRVVYNNEQIDMFLNYDYNSTCRLYGYYLAQHKIRFVNFSC
jgi:hypothetical protein